ncbi:hypothetical protein RHMOL_Rhmol10G0146200 [Rhododendron molle]|uniref:Uncharacterized protein n=1 Tax=Rhododendron molle TaxID=49168 RepID=A0ACC0M1Z3_RHOML|nr:hypothetical protein RHMOL_Rhmol10G0146200 [Rhododendron molle]
MIKTRCFLEAKRGPRSQFVRSAWERERERESRNMISIPTLESQPLSLLSTAAAVHHHLPPSLLSSSQLCPRLPPISTAASRCFFHPVSGPLRSFSVAATATFMANSVPPRNGVYTVGDFMTRKEDLHVVNPTTTVDEALELLVENRITGFPVIDDTWKLVGLVSDYDLLALDSISGGGRTDTNMFPEVDSTWKVCESHLCLEVIFSCCH